MTILEVVIERMDAKGYSVYRVENELYENGICSKTTFRNFHRGQSAIGSTTLQYIFKILDLDVQVIAK